MSKYIYNTPIAELLPRNLLEDPDIKAASKAMDLSFEETSSLSDQLIIWANLESQSDEVLDYLLFQSRIADEEKYLAETRKEKINLIRNSWYIHMIKGTPFSIEYVLQLLNMRGKISEWFEYGGNRGYFKIDIQVTTRGLTEKNTQMLERLVNAYKRKSAWIEVVNFHLTSSTKEYLASAMHYGEEITVYPWRKTNIETRGRYSIGSTSQSIETLTIYPE